MKIPSEGEREEEGLSPMARDGVAARSAVGYDTE